MSQIVRNSARCHGCGDEVESRSRHDFQKCSCGNIFVDGGRSYIRRGVRDPGLYEDTSITERRDND